MVFSLLVIKFASELQSISVGQTRRTRTRVRRPVIAINNSKARLVAGT